MDPTARPDPHVSAGQTGGLLPVGDALDRILAALAPVGTEIVSLGEAWGRVLAAPVAARLDTPPADVSAMDGYALRAADAAPGARLAVTGAAPAGHPFDGRVEPGCCVRIFTGAVVPDGADAILIQEEAECHGGTITVRGSAPAGRFIRRRGQDFARDDVLLAPGRRLTARDIGVAAAANHPWLCVYRQPRVAVLATGDEIALPGEAIPAGGIVSSNSPMLAAVIRAAGGVPLLLPVARDEIGAIARTARGALGADLLVTLGGASVGDHDLVAAALGTIGLELDFWKIAMRPGKPLMHGVLRPPGGAQVPLLGLPGNPVSAMVCSLIFLLPALARLSGDSQRGPAPQRAVLETPLPANDHRADHLRAGLVTDADGLPHVSSFERQDSGRLLQMARADALILRAPYAPAAAIGETVRVIGFAGTGL